MMNKTSYPDILEARLRIKKKGDEGEEIYLRPETVRSLKRGVKTSKYTDQSDSLSLGMERGLFVYYTRLGRERIVGEEETVFI